MVRNMNRWWWEYHRRFIRTSGLITITAALSYQPTMIVHHHSWFAQPASGDYVLLITAASLYEPAVKTFSLSARYMIRQSKLCCSINKFIIFSNKVRWKQTLYKSCRPWRDQQLCSWWLFHLKPFTVLEFCLKHLNFKIQNFRIVQTTLDVKITKTQVVDLDEIYKFIVDNYFIRNHL